MAGWGNNWNNYGGGGGGGGFGGFGGGGGGYGGGGGGMGMRGGWGPYGYNNMGGGFNRPRYGGGGGGGGGHQNKPLTLTEVKDWLDKQQPFVLQTVVKHCKELLTTKHNVPIEDMSDWYGEEDTEKNQTMTKSGENHANHAHSNRKFLFEIFRYIDLWGS